MRKGTGSFSFAFMFAFTAFALALTFMVGCGPAARGTAQGGRAVRREPGPSVDKRVGAVERGKATWYGGRFHGRKTASGEIFDENGMTAAHKTLPFDTRVRVTNLNNGRAVEVRITDRGPYAKGRIIDLSKAAATRLDMLRAGVVPVKLEVLKLGEKKKKRRR